MNASRKAPQTPPASPQPGSSGGPGAECGSGRRPPGDWRRNPWVVFLLPFVVFMLVGTLEPLGPDPETGEVPRPAIDLGLEYRHYPLVYTVKIALTVLAIGWVLPGYRQFPFRISPLALAVGLLGGVAWIALCSLQIEARAARLLHVPWLVDFGQRSAFNPLEQMADEPTWAYGFLAVRFAGLMLVVPILEEFFLRGFVLRYLVDADWWAVPFGTATRAAFVGGTLVPALMHPASELLAVVVWFSAVTWLMVRTRNIWDCVAAHAVTNLMLGLYVVRFGAWHLM